MGFGLPQEIFKETYQRPQIVNKEMQAEPKSWLRGCISTGAARISWESAKDLWRTAVGGVLNRILAEVQSPLPLPNPNGSYSKVSYREKIKHRLLSDRWYRTLNE
jgi:hypothetical protein